MYIIEIYDRIGRHWNELHSFPLDQKHDANVMYGSLLKKFPSWTVRLSQVIETNKPPE